MQSIRAECGALVKIIGVIRQLRNLWTYNDKHKNKLILEEYIKGKLLKLCDKNSFG